MVSFFLCMATWGRILAIDNIFLRALSLVNWCCLCRCDEVNVDHLVLHCKYAYAFWCEVFLMFGIQWMMPKTIAALLFGWRNWLGKHFSKIWNMVPTCLMRLIWREQNTHTFEVTVRFADILKS